MKLFDAKPVRQRLGRWLRLMRTIILWGCGLLFAVGGIVWLDKPDMGGREDMPLYTGRLVLQWADGRSETILDSTGYGRWVSLDRIPLGLAEAVVAVEDFRFFRHPGLDINQMYYALIENIRNLGFTYGASTITQQLIKNVWLDSERSLTRKLTEAIMALELEGVLSKQEILEWYLNIIEMAPGIFGVSAGSMYYFGKEPHELNFNQQLMLAAVIHAPGRYAMHAERALPRMHRLAVNLVEQKRITPVQATAVSNAFLSFSYWRPEPNQAGLRSAVLRLWPRTARRKHDLAVTTSLKADRQAVLEQMMHDFRAGGEDVFVTDTTETPAALVLASEAGARRMQQADPGLGLYPAKQQHALVRRLVAERVSSNRLVFSTNQVFHRTLDWSRLPTAVQTP